MNVQITKANIGTDTNIIRLSIRTYKIAGNFRINSTAMGKMKHAKTNRHVAIFVDKEAQTLTMKKASASDANAFVIGRTGNGYSIGMHNALSVAIGTAPLNQSFNGKLVGDSVIFDLKNSTIPSNKHGKKCVTKVAKKVAKKTYVAMLMTPANEVVPCTLYGADAESRTKALNALAVKFPTYTVGSLKMERN